MGNCCNLNRNIGSIVGFEMLCDFLWEKLQVNAIGNVPHRSMIMASYPIIIRNVLSPNWYLLPSAFNESSNLEVIWDISISANGYCCNKLSSNSKSNFRKRISTIWYLNLQEWQPLDKNGKSLLLQERLLSLK